MSRLCYLSQSLCITKFESDKSWNHPDPHQTAAK